MSRTARLGAVLALPLAAVLGLSACSAGQVSQTATILPDVIGTEGQVGNLLVQDARIATPTTDSYAPGSSLEVQMYVINQAVEADQIVSATINGEDAVVSGTAPQTSPIDVPGQTKVTVGKDVTIKLPSSSQTLYPSQMVPATFTFKNAGTLSIQLPIGTPWTQTPAPTSSFNFNGGEH